MLAMLVLFDIGVGRCGVLTESGGKLNTIVHDGRSTRMNVGSGMEKWEGIDIQLPF